MKKEWNLLWITLIGCFSSLPVLSGQTYAVGSVVEDYSFTDFKTGETVSLYDLGADGGVLVLEWYAYWCPFCFDSAGKVESGVIEHYGMTNGENNHGVPVKHIALNVQGGAESQGLAFANNFGFGTVVEDFDRSFFNLFSPGGGQPLFVIINAEANSPTSDQWEVLYTRLNYSGNFDSDIDVYLRAVIDGVEKGEVVDAVKAVFPGVVGPVEGYYQLPWFGWFADIDFPWVYHTEFGYLYLPGQSDSVVITYDLELGWLYASESYYPYVYLYSQARWYYYQEGSLGEWWYDTKDKVWKQIGDIAGG